MAIRPNWGKGRNLKVKTFEETTIAALETAVNDWLVALSEEQILYTWFGNNGTGNYQAIVLYTEE